MVYDFSWIDQSSFLLGFCSVLVFMIVASVTDLIYSFASWITLKAAQLRKQLFGDQPSLVDWIRKKFFPPHDAA